MSHLFGIHDVTVLSRPENAYHYSDSKPDVTERAAAYVIGLAKIYPVNNAHKRTTCISICFILKLDAYEIMASPVDKYKTIIRVAASDISEDELAQWIRKNVEKIRS